MRCHLDLHACVESFLVAHIVWKCSHRFLQYQLLCHLRIELLEHPHQDSMDINALLAVFTLSHCPDSTAIDDRCPDGVFFGKRHALRMVQQDLELL